MIFFGVGGGARGGIGTKPITPVATLFVAWNIVVGGLMIVCVVAVGTGVAGMIAKPGVAGPPTTIVVGVVGVAELYGICDCAALRKAVY